MPILHMRSAPLDRNQIPGALSILKGAVPGLARGLGYTAPTYFVGSRDRIFHRLPWIATLFHCLNGPLVYREAMCASRDLKKQLRREALSRRDALDPAWRGEVAAGLADFAEMIASPPSGVVSGFWPMRSELDLRPLMKSLAKCGARLALPAILDKTTIVFREYLPDAPLVDMGFGTQGPDATAAVLSPDIMLVPLAAFDGRGHRIGYGAGYYDRAIARLIAAGKAPRLIGTAFDCQEVERVPDEPHDIPLPEILTESGLRRFAPSL